MTVAGGSQICGQVDGSREFGDNKNMLEEVVKGWTERRHQACRQDGGWCPLQTQKDQVWEIMALSGQKLPSEQMDVLGWSRRCDIQTTLKPGRRH